MIFHDRSCTTPSFRPKASRVSSIAPAPSCSLVSGGPRARRAEAFARAVVGTDGGGIRHGHARARCSCRRTTRMRSSQLWAVLDDHELCVRLGTAARETYRRHQTRGSPTPSASLSTACLPGSADEPRSSRRSSTDQPRSRRHSISCGSARVGELAIVARDVHRTRFRRTRRCERSSRAAGSAEGWRSSGRQCVSRRRRRCVRPRFRSSPCSPRRACARRCRLPLTRTECSRALRDDSPCRCHPQRRPLELSARHAECAASATRSTSSASSNRHRCMQPPGCSRSAAPRWKGLATLLDALALAVESMMPRSRSGPSHRR